MTPVQVARRAVPVSLVIFDCDGVLVDTESISSQEMARSIREAGLPISYEEVKATFKGESLVNMAVEVERRLGRALPDGWLNEFQARRAEAFKAGLRAVPGARAVVEAVFAAGLDACVASQASLAKMHLTLGLTQLRAFFSDDRLFSSHMVRYGKPAPDLFLHAAATMGHAPAACLVIEDGVSGVRAARAAGMRVIGYAADSDPDTLLNAGGELVYDMSEVAPIIGMAAGRPVGA
jgi:HAD superfamily hydrolase (TIGR01509 family)